MGAALSLRETCGADADAARMPLGVTDFVLALVPVHVVEGIGVFFSDSNGVDAADAPGDVTLS